MISDTDLKHDVLLEKKRDIIGTVTGLAASPSIPIATSANLIDNNEENQIAAAIELFIARGRVNAQLLKKQQGNLIQAHETLAQLEKRGLVGPDRSPKSRELLVTREEWESMKSAGVTSKCISSSATVAWTAQIETCSQEPKAVPKAPELSETAKSPPEKPALILDSNETLHRNDSSLQPNNVRIKDIIIGKRFRTDLGDLKPLAKSIKERASLPQSIVITPSMELVCGMRRLMACRDILGWTHIPVRVVDIEDIVLGEYDENELRKDFTTSERVAIARAIEAKLPRERRGRDNPQNIGELKGRESAELAATSAGFGNAETYRQAAKTVEQGTPELVNALDKKEISISNAAVIATLPPEKQNEVVAAGPDSMKRAAAKQRAHKKLKKTERAPAIAAPGQVTFAIVQATDSEASPQTLIEQLSGLTLNPLDAATSINIGSAMVLVMDSKLAGELAPTAMEKFIAAVRELKFGVFLTTDLKKKLDPSGFAQSTKQKLRKKTSENRDSLAAMETEAPVL